MPAVDLTSSDNIRLILKNVNVVVHVGPPFHPKEVDIGCMMVDAARKSCNNGSGPLKHFIFSSVIGGQLSSMVHHVAKRRVEEHLIESGLPFTILQPSTFLDNIPVARLMEEPVYPELWNLDTRFSFTTLRDNAEALHRVLMEREEHFFAQYPIISTKSPTSSREVLSVIEKKINKEIEIKPLEKDAAAELLLKRASDSGAYAKEAVELMAKYYNTNGLLGNAKVLKMIIGREPMQVAEWLDWALEQAQ
ncbi:hypothetical protein N0V87_007186 [Didymella glomerata]|uniref:NmrA-like domain-containing protein n=1 Tax=Didymella glomerata TaxID=749621 RepID=A0A9W8WVB8_9PLEO|nr:hypothetical protein N0V87_007186 [Didymella glomerata]